MQWLQSMGFRGSESIQVNDHIAHESSGNVIPQPVPPHIPQNTSKILMPMGIGPQREKTFYGIGILKHYRPGDPQIFVGNTGGKKTVIIGSRYRRGFVADNPNLPRELRAGDYRKDDSVVQVGSDNVNTNMANTVNPSNRYRR